MTWYHTSTGGGGGGGSSGHNYSTTEQIIGTWIDGTTLYEKTINFTTTSSSNYTTQSLGLLTSNVNTIWMHECYAFINGTSYSIGSYRSSPGNEEFLGFVYKSTPNVELHYRVGSGVRSANAYITVRYTKTS